MATTVTSILRDGVTAAGVYPTFAAWRAALPANLVTADQIHILNVEAKAGGYLDTVFDTAGITTDATRYIKIQAAAGHRHAGVYDTAKALLKLHATTTPAWSIATSFIYVDGMQLEHSGITDSKVAISLVTGVAATNKAVFTGNIFKGGASGGGGLPNFFTVNDSVSGYSKLYLGSNLFVDVNNVDYPATSGAIAVNLLYGQVWAYNNTFVNCSRAFVGGNATYQYRLKNNLSCGYQGNAGRVDYSLGAGALASGTNNASSDGTAPGTSPRINQTFTFVGASDFHLAAGDTGARNYGADLSADADFPLTTDIDGVTYTVPWSIGASDASAVTNSIAITAPPAGRIYQRIAGMATIAVTGTYAGTLTAIKARLVLHGTSTPVAGFDWATKVATPSGNAYSFNFVDVPYGSGWYNVQVQDTVDAGITATGNKVGVGELIACSGQSNANRFCGGVGATTMSDLVRGFGQEFTNWQLPTSLGMEAFGNAMVTALGCPVGVVNTGYDGAPLWVWQGSNAAYVNAKAVFASVGNKFGGLLWIQGEADWNGTTYASYLADMETTMETSFRAEFGQATLPIVVAALGTYPGTSGSDTTTYAQVKKAQYDWVAGDANAYIVDRIDCDISVDGIHLAAEGSAKLGARMAQALKVAYGQASQYRGPAVSAVKRVTGTLYDVWLTHRLGSDITPATEITGFTATDPGAANAAIAVTSALRTSATKIRITLASTPVSLPVILYAAGANPVMTAMARDNSALTLPLEWQGGMTAVPLASSVTIPLVNQAGAAAASLTGLKWAFFDQATPGSFTAPVAQGTAESTDGSGNLVLDITGTTLDPGAVGWVVVTNSDGTTTQAPTYKHFSGPVVTA